MEPSSPKLKHIKVFPSGKDDGNGAQKLLRGYVDEVLERANALEPVSIPSFVSQKTSFKEQVFLNQLQHPGLVDVPLISQVTRQQAIWPSHSTENKKRFIDICKRLQRNDGGLVRARLSGEGVDDNVAKQIGNSLPNNIYLQHLMLHDNAITDEGVEGTLVTPTSTSKK